MADSFSFACVIPACMNVGYVLETSTRPQPDKENGLFFLGGMSNPCHSPAFRMNLFWMANRCYLTGRMARVQHPARRLIDVHVFVEAWLIS